MDNPIKMDDLGVPLFLETPIYINWMMIWTESWPWKNGWFHQAPNIHVGSIWVQAVGGFLEFQV